MPDHLGQNVATDSKHRPTWQIYLELCKMQGRGETQTPEYRALNVEYHAAIQAEIRAGKAV